MVMDKEEESELRKLCCIFVEEATEHIIELEQGLLLLERFPAEKELLNTIFRAAHTLKGTSGCIGFHDISTFTHAMEEILGGVRDEKLAVDKELITLLLESTDRVKEMVGHVASETAFDFSKCEDLLQRMKRLKNRPTIKDFKIIFFPTPDLFKRGMDPAVVIDDLRNIGEVISIKASIDEVPILSDIDPEKLYLRWDIVLRTDRGVEEIRNVFEFVEEGSEIKVFPAIAPEKDIPFLGQMLVEQGTIKVEDVEEALKTQKRFGEILVEQRKVSPADIEELLERQRKKKVDSFTNSLSSTIRVDLKKLDNLINIVGEMIINHSMFDQAFQSNGGSASEATDALFCQIRRIGKNLQECAMSLRMLPVGEVFHRFTRLARELSESRNKQVRLIITGGEIELDKSVLEKITDPLTHLVRNAIDHGIETPEQRIAQGKPAVGTISLGAYQIGDSVYIEVEDDGKGLEREKILKKARSSGIIKDNPALSEEQIHNLIFLPGFSTSEKTSDISGRGVGMDVVMKNVDSLNGNVSIRTKAGLGTTISIKLPLTLAIIDGLKILVGGEIYVLPITSVLESLRPRKEDLNTLSERREVINVRGEVLPVIRLHEVLGPTRATKEPAEAIMIVVVHEGRKYCLMADGLLGEQQLMIKNFGASLPKVGDIAGGTILGDGKVALVLYVPGLIENAAMGCVERNALPRCRRAEHHIHRHETLKQEEVI